VPTLADELRVIACYKTGEDLSDRLKAADEVQRQQSAALLRAADEIERLGGMKDLVEKVEQWGRDRCIIPNSTPQAQLLKSMSEMGELADATLKSDVPEIVDGIGDVLVTLILYAALQNLDIEDCLASAYDEIKDRKGTLTPEGVFVKDA
jgi:NTP pyrophosphatase (non-canonical NTP hydrolase)